ncbi:hypothetical protein M4R22_20745 [Acidovorax sp. GBBC 3334]|uniref:hypothetical protein n=1 Tax=Acidovorax sp. GBBC 3334 TaxID=2940496 RepID=UPI00230311D4|nr:hypothetical protein [Acidovorax sp. GBBC 3334]MDA8457193.1 hypothetical protein [Acidovorax sp. GBBC 3334]
MATTCSAQEVLRIRSLGSVSNPADPRQSAGSFAGMRAIAEKERNTNVVFVHGIGWTQETGSSEFGDKLVDAIARGFPGAKIRPDSTHCGTSSLDGRQEFKSDKRGLRIHTANPRALASDDPHFSVTVRELGCLDRRIVELRNGSTVTVYRFLWDDAMWNGAEWFHMGYDDPLPLQNGKKWGQAGYDDPDSLRASLNSQLKNSVVTYGLTDAALYMSPVGSMMREGVQAAVCAALTGTFDTELQKGQPATASGLCAPAPTSQSPLFVVSHSLGSRIVFDTLITDLTTTLADRIEQGTSGSGIELHMFANQIPLVGVGRMGDQRSTRRIAGKQLKIVAYSEINDLLTFELVPYFEQLYYVRCYGAKAKDPTCTTGPVDEFTKRTSRFHGDQPGRAKLVSDLGFDVVDVRLKYAPNQIWIYPGLKDPSIAHSGYIDRDVVLGMLLCGVEDGKPRASLADCRGHD